MPCFSFPEAEVTEMVYLGKRKRRKKMQKKRVQMSITAASLKKLAMISMVIDHTAAVFVQEFFIQLQTGSVKGKDIYLYMRCIGRMAFPLYLFLLTESIRYTKSGRRYVGRLFLWALISEIPYDLALHGRITGSAQNVLFTLAIGAASLLFTRYLMERGRIIYTILSVTVVPGAAAAITHLLHASYGSCGILSLYAIWLFQKYLSRPWISYVAGSLLLLPHGVIQLAAIAAVPVVSDYCGEKGTQKGKIFWYSFYPVHLFLLVLLRWLLT